MTDTQSTSPSTNVEYVYSLACTTRLGDPPQKVFFIASATGLHRSQDGGQTWKTVFSAPLGSDPVAVTSVIVPPVFRDRLEVVAGLPGGIVRSHDGGDTWESVPFPPPPPMVTSLIISPNFDEDDIQLAGTMEDGVFYTTDGGRRWVSWNFGLLDLNVLCLAASPNFKHDETLFIGTQSGIFRSPNGGRAWKEVDLPGGFEAVISLAFSPAYAEDGTLYAGTETKGLFCSKNRGKNWERIDEEFTESVNAILLMPEKAGRNRILALVGGIVFESLDGKKWKAWHSKELSDKDVSALLALSEPAGKVLVASAEGEILIL